MKYNINDFQKDVIRKSFEKPVLVDFWAEWCGPCKILGPVLEKLAEEQKDRWTFAKVDTEIHQDLAMQYGIRGIPNVKLFIDGEVVNEFTGALPEAAIRQWLKDAIPSEYQQHVEQAAALLANGERDRAISLLNSVLKAEPDNLQAKALLARVLVFSDFEKSMALARELEGTEFHNLGESLQEFDEVFASARQPEKLEDSPVKETYLRAIGELKQQKFARALEKFIDVIAENRYYDGDGSRKACIAIFKYLGEDHPLTREYRTAFSRALYV